MTLFLDKVGNWGQTVRGLRRFKGNTARANRKIVRKAGLIGQKMIVENINSGGNLAGKPFQANSSVTIALKGSSKPLIDNGDLLGSIRSEMRSPTTSFAGVLKSHPSGVNIGAIMEAGTNRAGRGNSVVIPERPFIAPVAESPKLEKKIKDMAEKVYDEEVIKKGFGL